MNFVSASALVLSALTKSGAVVTEVNTIVGTVTTLIQTAEGSGLAGDGKLAQVLNNTEAFLAKYVPHLEIEFEAFAKDLTLFINDVVAGYNVANAWLVKAEGLFGKK